jgi:hypothetical protein
MSVLDMLPPYPCLGGTPDTDCPETPTYPRGECTSGAAWWGSRVIGKQWPLDWGNAMNWPARARSAGFVVNGQAAVSSIMCLGPRVNGAGDQGHVAFVVALEEGKAEIVEMNFLTEHGFDERLAPIAGCEFIHLTTAVPNPPPPPQPEEEDVTLVAIRSAGSIDPLGAGACYLVKDAVYGPKRHITGNGDLAGYLSACGQTAPKEIFGFILDRMEIGPAIDTSITSPPQP